MINYELTVILRNKDVEDLQGKVKDILSKHGANVLNEENMGMRKLAYAIENENEGFYNFMTIESTPESVQKITNDFRLNSDILRYMFIKLKKAATA